MPASQTKDYYKTLGVDRAADDKAIKAAFKKLARKYHPDLNKTDPSAEDRFKDLNEAFNVLSDPSSRKLYNRYGADWERYRDAGFTGDEPAGGARMHDAGWPAGSPDGAGGRTFRFDSSENPAGFQDFAQSLFGNARGGDLFGSPRARKRRGEDMEVNVEISFDEAFKGAVRRLDIQTPDLCSTCGGAGFVRQAPCPTCDATGTITRAKTIEVKIPAGVNTGSRIHVAGQGGPGTAGGSRGSVWINITVRPDKRFERTGDDIKTELELPLYTAVLGGEIVVPTPTGKVALSVPPGSQNGRVFRLRGQGMPKLKSKPGERGDLLAKILVSLPTNLSEREQELFRELRSLRADERS